MRIGRRVAFDIGKARIGVAVSDPHGILASPRDFITRLEDSSATVSSMLEVIGAEDAIEIYVGLPTNLQNQSTLSTADAVNLATALQSQTEVPVVLIDERMSTKLASGAMTSVGKSTRDQRRSIDSASAAVILETALQSEKVSGMSPGIKVGDYSNEE